MLVGVNYTAPEMVVPDAWHHRLAGDLNSGSSSLKSWWRKFNDPTLNRLVDRARKANPDLKLALERVTEARAARGVARSQLFPTVGAGGDMVRSRASESLLGPVPPAGKTSDYWQTGFDAGWEIDFFGGVRRSIESATASEEAAMEAYRDATVSLLAEVALNYVEYRTLDERIRVARKNIARQERSLQLTRDKEQAGLVSKLNVSQIETTVRTSETLIPLLQAQRSLARNRLGTLVGGYPGSIDSWLGTSKAVPMPARSAGVGIPANLIRSRPDIRRAERELAAQTARIGVAEADLYPRFTLAGSFAFQAANPSDLLDADSRAYSFGPSFRWQIFSAGRIKNQIKIEESRTRQAYLAYESTVLRAVEDVENSLAQVVSGRARLGSIDKALGSARQTVTLVGELFDVGNVSTLELIDAERVLFTTEDEAIVTKGAISAGYISLYKALGGGTVMKLSAK